MLTAEMQTQDSKTVVHKPMGDMVLFNTFDFIPNYNYTKMILLHI